MRTYKYFVLYGDEGVSQEFDTPAEAERWARNFKQTLGYTGLIEIDKITIVPKGERLQLKGGEVDWFQGVYKIIQKGKSKKTNTLNLKKETRSWD